MFIDGTLISVGGSTEILENEYDQNATLIYGYNEIEVKFTVHIQDMNKIN